MELVEGTLASQSKTLANELRKLKQILERND
jgi:hypothetical protein